jgi:hypothetical protein
MHQPVRLRPLDLVHDHDQQAALGRVVLLKKVEQALKQVGVVLSEDIGRGARAIGMDDAGEVRDLV